jgi:hypothetical protein
VFLLAIFANQITSWERPFFSLFKTNKLIQSQTNLSKKSQDPSSIPARETYRENDPLPHSPKRPQLRKLLAWKHTIFFVLACAQQTSLASLWFPLSHFLVFTLRCSTLDRGIQRGVRALSTREREAAGRSHGWAGSLISLYPPGKGIWGLKFRFE